MVVAADLTRDDSEPIVEEMDPHDPVLLRRRLEVLEAESAIRRLVADHQWVSDAASCKWGSAGADSRPVGDPEDRTSAWATGAVWEGSGLSAMFDGATRQPMGSAESRFAADRPRWMPDMMHFLTNESIAVFSATAARGRWYSWEAATVVVAGAETAVWIAGRYDMRFVKELGAWRIEYMNFQEMFSTPFDSRGWTETAHVPYGPHQLLRQPHRDRSRNDRPE